MFHKLLVISMLFILTAVGSLHAASGPVGLWHLDENYATAGVQIIDASGYGNNGTLYTGDGTVNKAAAGKVGGAISFDGVNDYVDCGNSASLNPANAITLEAWFKSVSPVDLDTIIGRDAIATYQYFIYVIANKVVFGVGNSGGGAVEILNGPTITTGVWYHVVGVYDGSKIHLYLDGVESGTPQTVDSLRQAVAAVFIGKYRSSGGTHDFNGLIDEVAIYSRALDSTEIYEDYWTGMGVWPFSVASAYSYDTSKIEVTGGVARLKDLGGTKKDDAVVEYNSAFVAGDTTRGYSGTAAGADVSLVLDTATSSTYVASGTFESRVFDTASGCGGWQRINASVVNGDIANADSRFDSGLVSVWHMNTNSSSDTTIADAKGTNTGTLYCGTGGYNTTTAQMWDVNGKLGSTTYKCLEFDGTDDYVSVGNVGNVGSVEFWINDTSVADGVLELVNSTTYVSVVSSAITATGFTSPTVYVNGSSASASLGSGWNHVAVTTGTAVSAGSVGIGEANGDYALGRIDEMAIWNRALDSSEVADHYNAGAGKELHRAVKLQVRSGSTVGGVGSALWVGSLGDTTSYYNGTNENLVSCANFNTTHRFAQYKAWLNASTDSTRTPTVASVALVGAAGSVFDNTDGDFDLGTKSQVTSHKSQVTSDGSFVGLSKMPNGGYMSCGYYISHVFDAGGSSPSWQPLVWTVGGTEIDASENGLVGLWHMNGDWLDAKGANNGTASGATFSTSAKLGAACGSFDGTNDSVSVGNVGDVKSVEFWINDTSATDGVLELVNSTTYVSVASSAITATGFTSPTVYVNGNSASAGLSSGWNHVAVTTGTAISAGSVGIGEANGDYALGLIDEVAIYNRALGAAEVMNHYQNANPGTVKFQCRADSTVAGLATKTFTGYDSTSATFYETSGSGWGAQYDGRQYFQYRAYLGD